jgi:hypothetical protein
MPWYNFRSTSIVRFVADGCRKNLQLRDSRGRCAVFRRDVFPLVKLEILWSIERGAAARTTCSVCREAAREIFAHSLRLGVFA